jgi:hypothetical protein
MIYVPHNSFSFGWLSLLVLLSSIVGIINSGALTFPSHSLQFHCKVDHKSNREPLFPTSCHCVSIQLAQQGPEFGSAAISK